MTPVETLREAARLMRERAEAATPGPWWLHPEASPEEAEVWWGDRDHLIAYDRQRRDEAQVPWGVLAACDYDRSRADAEHIASWHPAVALALADQLDREADTAARFHDGRVGKYDLAVARAYLGQSMCHNGHPFVPGIAEDAPDTPDDRWCNSCGEARRAQPVMPARNEATR